MYVAGFARDERESITDLQTRYPSLIMDDFLEPRPLPDGGVELSVDPKRFRDIFCPDAPALSSPDVVADVIREA